ncbi:MAG TPA: hypothetical protein VFA16_19705, partial [Mycobacterium sp.]|nr:hypothetical protein [Mycobacterium sp.]
MGLLFRLAELLLVLVPLAGVIIAGVKAFLASQRRQIESSEPDRAGRAESVALGRAGGSQVAQWSSIKRVLEEHSRTDARWLEYELDVAKLLEFPLMTDMRDPLTIAFHKA